MMYRGGAGNDVGLIAVRVAVCRIDLYDVLV